MDQYSRDIITIITTEHLRRDTIRIMAIAISLTISIDLIAINRSDHLRRSVIMGHLTSVARLLTEVVDKKYNEIKKIIIIS